MQKKNEKNETKSQWSVLELKELNVNEKWGKDVEAHIFDSRFRLKSSKLNLRKSDDPFIIFLAIPKNELIGFSKIQQKPRQSKTNCSLSQPFSISTTQKIEKLG